MATDMAMDTAMDIMMMYKKNLRGGKQFLIKINKMKFQKFEIEGLVLIEPKVFEDSRGYFFESYNKKIFSDNGIEAEFVQDNQSMSQKGVVRGLHFQAPPYAQGKLVRVLQGSVIDVAVDLRKNSPTYGQHLSVKLTADNKKMFYIPEGFAHGFVTLEDNTIFSYKCTNYYNPQYEGGVLWNDPQLNINWQIENPILSEKDKKLPLLAQLSSPF
jgi:dTDP-4-dehydrorhamnose 3,5-epimerase